MTTALATINDLQAMAKVVIDSRMFPALKSEAAVVSLMLLCQADGLHPAQAMRRYHILSQGGAPAMKSETMLAEFQSHGGKVAWLENTDKACRGRFEAPGLSEPVEVVWTMEDAKRAGLLSNSTWQKYPRAMLRSRCISEAIRMAMPGVVLGVYTPEETESFSPSAREQSEPEKNYAKNREIVAAQLAAPAPVEPDFLDVVAAEMNDDAEITDPVDVFDGKTGELIGQRDGCTTAQKAKAHALKNELGIDDATWRTRLMDLFGKDSMSLVSREEASTLIDKLETRLRTYGSAKDKAARQQRRAESAAIEITGALADVSRQPGED